MKNIQPFNQPRPGLVKSILTAGLLAGTLDITGAILHYMLLTRKNPVVIFPYIASGIFGKSAFNGSLSMGLIGLLLHYLIAMTFTAFFFLIYPKFKFLGKNIVLSGLIYGIFVWLVMSWIVVPLSQISKFPSSVIQSIIGCVILMFAIGLPSAIFAYRYYLKVDQPYAQ